MTTPIERHSELITHSLVAQSADDVGSTYVSRLLSILPGEGSDVVGHQASLRYEAEMAASGINAGKQCPGVRPVSL